MDFIFGLSADAAYLLLQVANLSEKMPIWAYPYFY